MTIVQINDDNFTIPAETIITHLGVHGVSGQTFKLNGQEYELGATGIYEADNIYIKVDSFSMVNQSPQTSFVTYSIGKEKKG